MQTMIPEPHSEAHTELRHDAALDGIRGLAILMVLFCHLVYVSNSSNSFVYLIARGIKNIGFAGVDVFFALSGFLITRILISTVDDTHFFRNFYARRSLRIFPLYYGVLFVIFACTPIFHIHWNGDQWRLLTYSNRLFQSRSGPAWHFYYGGYISLVNFWSLHIEEQFYLLWPLFVYFLRTPRRLLPLATSICIACLGMRLWLMTHGFRGEFIYTSLVTRADSLLVGGCLALSLHTKLQSLVRKVATPLFLLSLALFVAVYSLQVHSAGTRFSITYSLQWTFLALSCSTLIAMALKPRSLTACLLRAPFLRFFGKYSYGIYIYHSILPMFYFNRLHSFTDSMRSPFAGHMVDLVVELALTIGVSILSYHYFESPILKLKRFFPPSHSKLGTNLLANSVSA